MKERTPTSPPHIQPVAEETGHRPLWSVMIPTYNCTPFLRLALQSVLSQDPGEQFMQIQVVDDHSTDADVEAVVAELGKGRVQFFRQEQNRGSLRNFETCLNLSRGTLVHMLHGDDMVKPGFYAEIERLYNAHPEIGAAFTASIYIDHEGVESPPFETPLPKEPGVIPHFLELIARSQYIQTPSVVVRRSVYEKLGSFFAVHYGEDWEMWIRIAAHYPVAYSPEKLAVYRGGHSSSISGNWVSTGKNVQDIARVIDIAQHYLPPGRRKTIRKTARKNFSVAYATASNRIYYQERRAAFIQAREALRLSLNIRTVYWVTRLYLIHIGHLLHVIR